MDTEKQTLIRLTANALDSVGKQAIFEGTFNDGILIKPNSQIALQSCSLARDQDSFLVNSTNNKMSFQISTAGGVHEIFLTHGLYDRDTLFNLLNDIQDKMNNQLDIFKTKEHNTFIQVQVNSQNKVNFNFMLGKSQSLINTPADNDPAVSGIFYSKNNGTNEIIKGGVGTSQYITGTANYTPETGTRQYVYSSIPFNQGAGQIKARLDRFQQNPSAGDEKKSGFVLGLLPNTSVILAKLQSENSNHKILQGEYVYAICSNLDGNPASPYMIKHPQSGGNFIATAIVPKRYQSGSNTQNDIISIRMSKGQIQLVISRNAETEVIVYEEPLIRRTNNADIIDLLPYAGIFGSANQTRLANTSFSLNPEDNDQAGVHFEEEELIVGATPYPIPRARATIYNLIFNREALGRFLGFQDQEQNPNSDRTDTTRYTATDEVTQLFSTSTYLIEMLSEQLISYDSFDQGRKNILAPIPLSDHVISSGGIIHYEPNNLMFINLKNDKEKLIRNMRCRIVTNAYGPIKIEGLAEINLLVKG